MTFSRLVAIASSIIVIGAVMAGLYISGSPGEQRLKRLDDRRIADLSRLSRATNSYWMKSDHLPINLFSLVDGQRMRSLPTDPETQVQYPYEIIDSDSYRLCAEFSRASAESASDDFWSHLAGLQCFDFGVAADG